MNLADRQCLGVVEGRQQSRQPPGQHGFTAAGWAHQQQVMFTCCGNFQRPSAVQLPLHRVQVGGVFVS
jgi:hypothetical protein